MSYLLFMKFSFIQFSWW